MADVVQLVPRPVAPKAPRGLSKLARAEWDRIAPILRERGTLTAETEQLVAAYAGAVGMIAEIDREMSRPGFRMTIKGGNGVPRAHPLIGSRNRASQNALQYAKRLGLFSAPASPSNKGGAVADDYADLGI